MTRVIIVEKTVVAPPYAAPAETIKKLERAGVKEKAEQNIERYQYAEEKTGLPWQVVAALHFREGGMDAKKSITNGETLSNHINSDGVLVSSDPNQDAVNAAEIFIRNLKNVYDIDIISDPSPENYAWGFLSYNRGSMYKCNGNISYDKSPYVMNFYDSDHMNMSWINADSKNCRGETLNNVAGKKNDQVGALVVLSYLCGGDSDDATDSNDEGIALDSDSSISANGREFIWYNQCDSAWRDSSFGSSTVCKAGCGPTSFAMMATELLGKKITPDETAKIAGDAGIYVKGSGSSWEVTRVLAEHYGLEYKDLNSELSSGRSSKDVIGLINQYLKDGWMIHTSGRGKEPFTSGGHYIGIRGIASNGEWLIADSGHRKEYSIGRTWEPSTLISAGMSTGNIKAIRSSSKSGGNNACQKSDVNTDNTAGFETINEANDIIKAYKKDKLEGLNLITPDTGDEHDNCVALSAWFIDRYTQVSYEGIKTGHGKDFVTRFIQNNKESFPDLQIEDSPSVYSVMSVSVPVSGMTSGNHTGIVIGIDEEKNQALIAEARYNDHQYTGVHSYNISDITGPGIQYVNLNKILKTNSGLRQ